MRMHERVAIKMTEYVKENGFNKKVDREGFYDWLALYFPDVKRNSMYPTDLCYNRYNKGLGDFVNWPHCLIYDEELDLYQLVGQNYPYTGRGYQYDHGKKKAEPVGEWVNGTFMKY